MTNIILQGNHQDQTHENSINDNATRYLLHASTTWYYLIHIQFYILWLYYNSMITCTTIYSVILLK